MSNLSKDAIRHIAFETTGQRDNYLWSEMRSGKLTASNFGKALKAILNPHPINIQKMRDDIYHPRDLSNVPAIKWGVQHEKQAIDEYVQKTRAIVMPTGVWLFPNGVMGASPDGLVYEGAHDRDPVGILEVKCPYSMRDFKVNCAAEWHSHLKYLDCENRLLPSHPYYHQVQGEMYAVGVRWCDFIIWTPHDMLVMRVGKDAHWGPHNLGKLEHFYTENLRRPEDKGMDWESADSDSDYDIHPFEEPTRDFNLILHPMTNSDRELRYYLIQTIQQHIARWIFEMHSESRSGLKWSDAVARYWDLSMDRFCEACVRTLFKQKWSKHAGAQTKMEVGDVIKEINDEEYVWASLMYDTDFARVVRTRVRSYEPTYGTKIPACTCHSIGQDTRLEARYHRYISMLFFIIILYHF